MKRKMKVLSLLAAIAMTTAAFAGCGANPSGSPSSGGGTPSSSGNSGPKETVELTWWHWGESPKNPDAVIEALNKKSAEDIGVTIRFLWATGEDTKLKTALSTGAEDDIAFTCSWFAYYPTTAQSGQLLDITDKLSEQTPDLWNYIPDYVWEGSRVNGRIYAVPTYKDVAAASYWYCNKEYVFDQAGAEAEFMAPGERNAVKTPLMKKLYEYAQQGNPYPHDLTAPYVYNNQGPRTVSNGFEDVFADAGLVVELGDDTHEVKFMYSTDNYIADLQTLVEWYKAGYVNQDCAQLEKEPEFCVVNQAAGWKGAEVAVWGLNKDYTVAICQRTKPVASTSSTIGSMQGIFANSKHPDEALKFIEYMNLNESYRNMLGYGIEGTNWKDNGDGTVTRLGSDWEPGLFSQATFFTLKPVAPAPATMYTDMKAEMDQAIQTDLLGFVFDMSNVTNEVAACSAVINKHKTTLVCGTMSDASSYVADVLNELKTCGWDKIRDEAQKQVDEFLKNKAS